VAISRQRATTSATTRDYTWLAEMLYLADFAVRLDLVVARDVYEALREFAGRVGTLRVYHCFGAVDGYLARLAAHLGDVDAADALYRSAIRTNRAIGDVIHLARVLADYGEFLTPIAPDVAAGHLAEASALADRHHLVATGIQVAEAQRSRVP
jgi:hypothetical protein